MTQAAAESQTWPFKYISLQVACKEQLLCYHLSFSKGLCAWSCWSCGSLGVSKVVQKKKVFLWDLNKGVKKNFMHVAEILKHMR